MKDDKVVKRTEKITDIFLFIYILRGYNFNSCNSARVYELKSRASNRLLPIFIQVYFGKCLKNKFIALYAATP